MNQRLATRVNQAYLRSDAFQANVIQAVRAAETAESEDKLRFIARALAGCTLSFQGPEFDKSQTMRLVEAMTEREMRVFITYFKVLDAINPKKDSIPMDTQVSVDGMTRQEFVAALLGLEQLGILSKENLTDRNGEWVIDTPAQSGRGFPWQLTALARQVAALARIRDEAE